MNRPSSNVVKSKKTPSQVHAKDCNVLRLDLHGCSVFDAERIVPVKVEECFQAGFQGLLIVYGKSGADLAIAVHKTLRTHVNSVHCHSLKCMGLGYGKYAPVENGSAEDVAVMVILRENAAPARTRFSGFQTTYAGEVEGFTLGDPMHQCDLSFVENAFPPRQRSPSSKKMTVPQKRKEIVFPREWLKGKRNK